ncbi:hypothetical protein MP638_004192 [Amoeboaphelidium occidentale]|nr:hypothetical protein MP638_004192 [Amoeboaphelidium occidentale]
MTTDTELTAEHLKRQGNAAFQSGDYNTSIKLFTNAIQKDNANHVLYSNRSASYCGLKEYEKALEDAEKCVGLSPEWGKGYGRKGAALFGLGKFDDAVASYEKGLQLDPNNAALKKGLEDALSARASGGAGPGGMGNLFGNMFSGDLLAKVAASPQLAPFLTQRDYVEKLQEIQKNPDSMVNYLSDPRIVKTMAVFSGIDIKMADPGQDDMPVDTEPPKTESKPAYEPAPPAEPEQEPEPVPEEEAKAKQLKEQANGFYKQKKFDEALEKYTAAWELYKDDITILTNKGAVLFELGKYDDCIKVCEEAVERGREVRADFKHIARALYRIGNSYFKLENYTEAIKFLQKSLTEHRNAETLNRLKEAEAIKDRLEREAYQDPAKADEARTKGNELFKDSKYAEAVSFYSESIKRAEKDPRGYSNRAACYTKLMALPEALRDVEKAISLDQTFIKAYIRKAAIQFQMKEYTKCMQTCDDALVVDAEYHQGKNAAELQSQKQKAQFAMMGYGADEGQDESLSQEEKLKRAMQNPKVQEILADPVMRQILEQMSTNPEAARDHLKNPSVREKVQILAAAGVISIR